MNDLYNKLKNYNLKDAINFEKKDRQFLALKKLWTSPQPSPLKEREYNKKASIYLFLIIANSLICYQLSGKGEDYWEEFGTSPLIPLLLGEGNIDFSQIYNFFEEFLPASKNNKRFIETKLNRIKKLEKFTLSKSFHLGEKDLNIFEFYYKNMDKLVLDLSKIMNQKKEAKTIVFAVKMFSYGARNVFGYLEYFPKNLMIPIDSRLENLYKRYSLKAEDFSPLQIKEFYINLSRKLKIPLLHLDAILWVNYEELMR